MNPPIAAPIPCAFSNPPAPSNCPFSSTPASFPSTPFPQNLVSPLLQPATSLSHPLSAPPFPESKKAAPTSSMTVKSACFGSTPTSLPTSSKTSSAKAKPLSTPLTPCFHPFPYSTPTLVPKPATSSPTGPLSAAVKPSASSLLARASMVPSSSLRGCLLRTGTMRRSRMSIGWYMFIVVFSLS